MMSCPVCAKENSIARKLSNLREDGGVALRKGGRLLETSQILGL